MSDYQLRIKNLYTMGHESLNIKNPKTCVFNF